MENTQQKTLHITVNGNIVKEEQFAPMLYSLIAKVYDSVDFPKWNAMCENFITDCSDGRKSVINKMRTYQQMFINDIEYQDANGVHHLCNKALENYIYCCDNECFNDMEQPWVILDIMTAGILSELEVLVLEVSVKPKSA